jgi:hypothetical protein
MCGARRSRCFGLTGERSTVAAAHEHPYDSEAEQHHEASARLSSRALTEAPCRSSEASGDPAADKPDCATSELRCPCPCPVRGGVQHTSLRSTTRRVAEGWTVSARATARKILLALERTGPVNRPLADITSGVASVLGHQCLKRLATSKNESSRKGVQAVNQSANVAKDDVVTLSQLIQLTPRCRKLLLAGLLGLL